MDSVEVHRAGDAALTLTFPDGRRESVTRDLVSRSSILSDLLASAHVDGGNVMHLPRGYLQAWLGHARRDMLAPPRERGIESLILLLKAADFLADEASINSLCADLGHRVFDASVAHYPGSAGSQFPVAEGPPMAPWLPSDALGECLKVPTTGFSEGSSAGTSPIEPQDSATECSGATDGATGDVQEDGGALQLLGADTSSHGGRGEQIIAQLPEHLAVSVVQAAGVGIGVCLARLPEAFHPLALCALFPSATRAKTLRIIRDDFDVPPSSQVLRSLFRAAAHFTALQELHLSPRSADAVSGDVVTSFEHVLARLKNLTSLHVDDNFLTDGVASVVARALPRLTRLRDLMLKAPIFWPRLRLARRQALQEALVQCPGLTKLSLSTIYGYYEESDERGGESALATALVHMSRLETLSLTAGSVNSGTLRALQALLPDPVKSVPWLPCMHRIRELNLSANTSLRDDGAKILAPILSALVNLNFLDISWNGICPEGAEALAPAFEALHELRFINISFNDLYDQGVAALARAWKELHRLEHLNMNMCSVSGSGCVHIAAAVAEFSNLTHLDLSRCLLVGGLFTAEDDVAGARALAGALRHHRSLRHLDLFGSGLNGQVMVHMAPCIAQHRNLTCLDLRDRAMSSLGVEVLCERVTALQNLQVLSVCCLAATVEAANALADALQALTDLRSLDLTHFHSSAGGSLNIAAALPSIKRLERLDFSYCDLSPSAAMALASGLRTMTFLQVLHLNGNPIGDQGVQAVAHALAPLHALTHVSLADTHITLRGAEAVGTALAGRENIKQVVLMMNGLDRDHLSENLRKPWLLC